MAQDDRAAIESICQHYGDRPDALIEILHDVQAQSGCVPDEAVRVIAERLNLSRADVHGVRGYYTDFAIAPVPARRIKLCRAEACQAVGADRLAEALGERLQLGADGRSPDGETGVETVFCLGNCALGPAALIGDRLIGRADADRLLSALEAEHG